MSFASIAVGSSELFLIVVPLVCISSRSPLAHDPLRTMFLRVSDRSQKVTSTRNSPVRNNSGTLVRRLGRRLSKGPTWIYMIHTADIPCAIYRQLAHVSTSYDLTCAPRQRPRHQSHQANCRRRTHLLSGIYPLLTSPTHLIYHNLLPHLYPRTILASDQTPRIETFPFAGVRYRYRTGVAEVGSGNRCRGISIHAISSVRRRQVRGDWTGGR